MSVYLWIILVIKVSQKILPNCSPETSRPWRNQYYQISTTFCHHDNRLWSKLILTSAFANRSNYFLLKLNVSFNRCANHGGILHPLCPWNTEYKTEFLVARSGNPIVHYIRSVFLYNTRLISISVLHRHEQIEKVDSAAHQVFEGTSKTVCSERFHCIEVA